MEKHKNISMAVIKRLPKYHRYLEELMKNEVDRISSKELGEKIGFTASQIRQDLNCFGDFGQQGYGYNVKELYTQISAILGLDRGYEAALVGAGNIGQAVSNYSRFENLGFKITAIFDANPKLIGMKIRDVEIMDIDEMESVLEEHKIDIGIICVPRKNAQVVADELIRGGVRAIWNFAPVDLVVPDHVKVENVHLSESLLTLIYLLNESEG
ncbi:MULTISPECIES: redox-sensing transcriptional repressor Rex [Clostridium]|jgi:redox-sensing transcriptional repressor|uniref:Redox-sensing transcriptional repressor Rex n=3 Tax=Clostridium TaxID=1485 RepID=A0A0B5QJY5_CLOBE|nr:MULTISPECIES: redox-sensing transcriptional repressor Rex [Clostridium]AJG97023.1 redox-sensing transcriptional repressor Rex [Clostridium beijerinckii]ALB48329.1 redox-sensing transcriptional repressor Rex [Clostridium beijerinckii NRRL B-598]AQS02953.1 redox-sensing transcriptional repressor Rex [Clostridium beijerinckii]AVK49403.1 redox-sensing transcriptional repressor Rex [Clostridium sp. MF28]MBA2886312.1 redox-sensing transcriptional repressor [Clostridium beijerinckii]